MGRSHRKRRSKIRKAQIVNGSQKIDETNAKIANAEAKQKLRIIRIDNFQRTVERVMLAILKILGLVIFGGFLLSVLGALVWWIYSCYKKDPIADIVMTILQVLTGIVSLAVGIWALVLTIKSRPDTTNNDKLNIKTQTVDKSAEAMSHEQDINPSSL